MSRRDTTFANDEGKHAYVVEAKDLRIPLGDQSVISFEVVANNRASARVKVERLGYAAYSVNMVG